MEIKNQYLPTGTVVMLKDGKKKIMNGVLYYYKR